MTFGALEPCDKCNGGQLVFRSGFGYQCLGNLSEWSKCEYQHLDPKRSLFKVPDDLKQYQFL
jgi:poly [ADP-ribose] polymerase